MWSFNYNDGIVTWSFQWYIFPFQLCTMPLYIALICLFLKKCKLRDYLLSFVSLYTWIASLMVILMPDSCFTNQVIININTMYIHCFAFVFASFIIINEEVRFNFKTVIHSFFVFLVFVFIALMLNIIVYKSGVLNGQVFNMFYISPYFPCSLPVFSQIYEAVPYPVFLIIYILSLFIGLIIIYYLIKLINSCIKDYNKL